MEHKDNIQSASKGWLIPAFKSEVNPMVMNVDNHDLPLAVSWWWQQRNFWSLMTLLEAPSWPELLGSVCLHTAGFWGKDVGDQESDCSWVMTAGRWDGRKGAWAVHHWINWNLRPRDTCMINLDKETTGAPISVCQTQGNCISGIQIWCVRETKIPQGRWGTLRALSSSSSVFPEHIVLFGSISHAYSCQDGGSSPTLPFFTAYWPSFLPPASLASILRWVLSCTAPLFFCYLSEPWRSPPWLASLPHLLLKTLVPIFPFWRLLAIAGHFYNSSCLHF